jgi:hypothetical protein
VRAEGSTSAAMPVPVPRLNRSLSATAYAHTPVLESPADPSSASESLKPKLVSRFDGALGTVGSRSVQSERLQQRRQHSINFAALYRLFHGMCRVEKNAIDSACRSSSSHGCS